MWDCRLRQFGGMRRLVTQFLPLLSALLFLGVVALWAAGLFEPVQFGTSDQRDLWWGTGQPRGPALLWSNASRRSRPGRSPRRDRAGRPLGLLFRLVLLDGSERARAAQV